MSNLTSAERTRIVKDIVEQVSARLEQVLRRGPDLDPSASPRGRAMIRYQPNPTATDPSDPRTRAMIRYQPNPEAAVFSPRGRAMIRYQPTPLAGDPSQPANLRDLVVETTRNEVREALQEAFAALGMKLPPSFAGAGSARKAETKPKSGGRKGVKRPR